MVPVYPFSMSTSVLVGMGTKAGTARYRSMLKCWTRGHQSTSMETTTSPIEAGVVAGEHKYND